MSKKENFIDKYRYLRHDRAMDMLCFLRWKNKGVDRCQWQRNHACLCKVFTTIFIKCFKGSNVVYCSKILIMVFLCSNCKNHSFFQDMDQPEEVAPRALTGYRMKCVYGMKDGRTIFAADTHNRYFFLQKTRKKSLSSRIRRYFAENNRDEETLFTEECQIVTFKVHPSEK